MIRQDKFKVGDKVEWDPRLEGIVDQEKRFGDGPFTIIDVINRGSRNWRSMGHTQHLILKGVDQPTTWSGAFFKPLRKPE